MRISDWSSDVCSSDLPTRTATRERVRRRPLGRTLGTAAGHPYSVLLPVGFALPPPLPEARCALTAPFHPCPPNPDPGPAQAGGLLSVALSLGSPPPGVTRNRSPVAPGLSSPPGPR